MKVTIEVDCTPEEARRFLGLPDLTPLNEQIVSEMQSKVAANMALLQPEELIKTWTSFGQGAQDQFRRLMEAGLKGAKSGE